VNLLDEIQILMKWIPLDIELGVGIAFEKFSNLPHIVRANVPLIRAGMNGDPVRTGVQAYFGGVNDAGDANRARITQGRDFVDVNA
jgi:hypothetical protein